MGTGVHMLKVMFLLCLLAVGLSVADPRISGVSVAWAQDSDDDDDDDGGGGDDDEDGGPSSGGPTGGGDGGPVFGGHGGGGDLFAPLRRLLAPAPTPRAPAVRAPRPPAMAAQAEIVASGLGPVALGTLVGRGYRVIAESQGIDRPLYRLAVPPGVSLEAARDEVRAQPGATADLINF